MITVTVYFCFLVLSAATILALWRLLAGPTVLDRVIGFDMAAICSVGMISIISVLWETELFIEIMMIFSLLGFVGTISFVSYLKLRPDKLLEWKEPNPPPKE
jgi:multisubunit Na+/H+ antiporter MnhF subunit